MHADWLKVFPTDSHWIAGFLHILVTHHRRERNCPCPCNKCRTGKISKFCVKNNDVTWHQNILSAGSAIQCQWVASLFFFVFLLFFCWQCRFLFLVWDSIYIHHFFSFGWCIRWLNNGWTSIFRRYSMNDLLNELETFVKTVNEYQQSPNWGADIWTWLMRLMKSKWSKHFELFSTNSAFSFFQVMLVGADKYNYSWNSRPKHRKSTVIVSISLSLSILMHLILNFDINAATAISGFIKIRRNRSCWADNTVLHSAAPFIPVFISKIRAMLLFC